MTDSEKILKTEYNLPWLPQPNEALTVLSGELPPTRLISTVFVLAFMGDQLLQTKLVKRGWDLIGGHIEPGESPVEALEREAYEEARVRLGPLHLLGYQRLHLSGPRPLEYRYSYPDSYQVFYQASIVSFDDFSSTGETSARGLFSPTQAEQFPWVQAHRELYQSALLARKGAS